MNATAQMKPNGPLPTALAIRDNAEEISALWTMTAKERVEAMWNGSLTLSQLCAWSSRRPNEVPLLGNEFAWIVMRTPDCAEHADEHRDNVVHLPERSEHRAAA